MKKHKQSSAEESVVVSQETEIEFQRQKSRVTSSVLRYNHTMVKLMTQMNDGLKAVADFVREMDGQRELQTRMAMTVRAMNSMLRLLAQGKLHLWMIDDDAIAERIRNARGK